MLFHSWEFIFVFLPIVMIGYFAMVGMSRRRAAIVWLTITSVIFYSWWKPVYFFLIMPSMIFNYIVGTHLGSGEFKGIRIPLPRKVLFFSAIGINLALLGYYKYADFAIENVNALFGTEIPLLHIMLPLAISFFTFQQVAYLVDSYRGETKEYDFVNYCLFVTFFPQLIAGPIVHHAEVMPQFADDKNIRINGHNIALGFYIFFIGLFKKVVVADTFAIWASSGFDNGTTLSFVDAWVTSISYTMQLYFDFSGYSDMAIGAGWLFNIRIPYNFNSPYKALNIQDFWRRWHITLSRWLRDYLYIPLGGNRKGKGRTYLNLFLTFLLGGLWHGAGWTFVLWGAMHGAGTAVQKAWQDAGFRLPRWLAWGVTLFFVHCAWVFFRAKDFASAMKVFKGMFGMTGWMSEGAMKAVSAGIPALFIYFKVWMFSEIGNLVIVVMFVVFIPVALFARNSNELGETFEKTPATSIRLAFALFLGLFISFMGTGSSEFLYFNF